MRCSSTVSSNLPILRNVCLANTAQSTNSPTPSTSTRSSFAPRLYSDASKDSSKQSTRSRTSPHLASRAHPQLPQTMPHPPRHLHRTMLTRPLTRERSWTRTRSSLPSCANCSARRSRCSRGKRWHKWAMACRLSKCGDGKRRIVAKKL